MSDALNRLTSCSENERTAVALELAETKSKEGFDAIVTALHNEDLYNKSGLLYALAMYAEEEETLGFFDEGTRVFVAQLAKYDYLPEARDEAADLLQKL